MKKIAAFALGISLISHAAFAGCPDLSGNYRITDKDGKTRVVTLAQTACSTITDVEQVENVSRTSQLQLDGIPRDMGSDYYNAVLASAQFNGDTLVLTIFSASAAPAPESGAAVVADIGSMVEKISKKPDGNLDVSYANYDKDGKVLDSYESIAVRQ